MHTLCVLLHFRGSNLKVLHLKHLYCIDLFFLSFTSICVIRIIKLSPFKIIVIKNTCTIHLNQQSCRKIGPLHDFVNTLVCNYPSLLKEKKKKQICGSITYLLNLLFVLLLATLKLMFPFTSLSSFGNKSDQIMCPPPKLLQRL